MKIIFTERYKSITPFTWSDIPNFIIITGLNGTGKSQLLQLIYNTVINKKDTTERVVFEGKSFAPGEVSYLTGEWQTPPPFEVNLATIQQRRSSYYNKFSSEVINFDDEYSIRLNTAFAEVARRSGKDKIFITKEEFDSFFPEYFVERDTDMSERLAEMFYNFRLSEIELQANGKSEQEIKNEIGEKPWVILRKIIEESKLPFLINDPSTRGIRDNFRLVLTHKFLGGEINLHDLSSGEKVLLSLVFYLYNSQEKNIFPKLLLLDEPDAHLHPSMVQQFINVVKKVLVDEYKVQVFMSTHSPSTVALAPEESLFVMNQADPKIEKINKDKAIKILTAGVPSLSINYENRKQVFVESKYDAEFYEKIYRKLLPKLESEISLDFISSGVGGSGNSSQVIEVVDKLVGFGNKAIFGIIDWDCKNTRSDQVKTLGINTRYSIENYLFDPILISALLLREKWIKREDLGLTNNESYIDFKYLSVIQIQAISDFLTNKVAPHINPADSTTLKVQYSHNFEIQIPRWYLVHQGHDLEIKLKIAFPQLNKYNHEAALKREIVNKIIDDLPDFIPLDILELFRDIQTQ